MLDGNDLWALETEHTTKFGIEEFFDFYNNSGWYNIERGENYIVIKGYIDQEKALAANNDRKYPIEHMDFTVPIRIDFKSGATEGVTVFTLSYAE